jgi:hypothetical protein
VSFSNSFEAKSRLTLRHLDVIGVCAMDKKARSKPMRYILDRMLAYGNFEVVIFGDKTIIDEGMTARESDQSEHTY